MLCDQFLERLDAALMAAVPSVSIDVHGVWTSRVRRSNQIDVVDWVWDAVLTSTAPFTGIAFLQTELGVYWAKAASASQEITARVSFHADAEARDARKTFAVALADVHLPSVPVMANLESPSEYLVDTAVVPAGRVACLARCDGNSFFVALLPAESVKFGRNRLWRARESIASHLPPDIVKLLTRRRAGLLRPGPTTQQIA